MKLGKAFSDNIIIEQHTRSRLGKEEGTSWWIGAGRALMFTTVFFISFFILVFRLFDLTLVHGRTNRALADGNRIRELVRHAPRGLLLDRTGKPLVANKPHYRLVKPCEGHDNQVCHRDLTQEEGDVLKEKGLPPGNFLEVDYQRVYLYPDAAAHLLGYTGELSEEELTRDYFKLRGYHAGDRVGRMGAEAVFEERLRGRDGRELVEVDATGKVLRTLGRYDEVPGEDITLSVDIGVMQAVASAFPKDAKGAIVVSKPTSGEILALYSSPTFNPNTFSLGISQDEYAALAENPDQPMFDRAIGGTYPPGSIFKLISAVGGLEEGAIDANTLIDDVGILTIGTFSFPNWYFKQYGKTEGLMDIVKALARSNDIFFYKLGEKLGITKLASWARTMGIGKPTGIEIAGEASGLMPDPAWKNAQFTSPEDKLAKNNEWYLGDTYHVTIGQGYLLATPIQANTWTNVVANGGSVCRPTIKKQQAGILNDPTRCKNLKMKKETIQKVTEGMLKACQPGGTGYPLFNFTIANGKSVPIACKTGTAEYGDPKNKTHAWFTAFAPTPAELVGNSSANMVSGDPEISVTVLVEGAGEGSTVAAPITKKIFEEWFGR